MRLPSPSPLLRALRPGIQVPLANACTSGGLAALVMHASRTSDVREEAFPFGIAVTFLASLLAARVLFSRTNEAHVARVRAVLWPPVVGGIAGVAVDGCMHLGTTVRLSIAAMELGGGAGEVAVVAVLSATAGLLGTALVLPQVIVLERAERTSAQGSPRRATLADQLAMSTWGVALAVGVLACLLARRCEIEATAVLMAAGGLGLAGQCARVWRMRRAVAPVTSTPYR